VQSNRFAFVDDGVPSVSAALEANNDVCFLSQRVNHRPFAFVSPLSAYNNDHGHVPFLL
jgi:hypothetical protein